MTIMMLCMTRKGLNGILIKQCLGLLSRYVIVLQKSSHDVKLGTVTHSILTVISWAVGGGGGGYSRHLRKSCEPRGFLNPDPI